MVDAALIKAMKDAGYSSEDHGATRDTAVLGGDHYYLLSPKTNLVERPSSDAGDHWRGLVPDQ